MASGQTDGTPVVKSDGALEDWSMKLSFLLTEAHVLAARRIACRRLGNRYKRSLLYRSAGIGLLLATLFVLASLGKLHGELYGATADKWFAWLIGSLLIGCACVVLILVAINRIGRQVSIAAISAGSVDCELTATRDGLEIRCFGDETRLKWRSVLAIEEDLDYVFLILVNENCLAVPRSAFPAVTNAEDFLRKVRYLTTGV